VRGLIVVIALLAATMPAIAFGQKPGSGGGYSYPAWRVACSPLCTGASASWTVPVVAYSGSGGKESIFQWIGISEVRGPPGCPGSCLGQLGTYASVTPGGEKYYAAWWELYCPTGAPCNRVQEIHGFPVSPGDQITASMRCVANCTKDNPGQQWYLALINTTRKVKWDNGRATFNWPLAMESVSYLIELVAAGAANFGVSHFSDAMVTQGRVAMPARLVFPNGSTFQHIGSGVAERFSVASPPAGANANNFDVCYVISTTLPPCPTTFRRLPGVAR
jgi:hypothetical protein